MVVYLQWCQRFETSESIGSQGSDFIVAQVTGKWRQNLKKKGFKSWLSRNFEMHFLIWESVKKKSLNAI